MADEFGIVILASCKAMQKAFAGAMEPTCWYDGKVPTNVETLTPADVVKPARLFKVIMLRLMDPHAPLFESETGFFLMMRLYVQDPGESFHAGLLQYPRDVRIAIFGQDFTDFFESKEYLTWAVVEGRGIDELSIMEMYQKWASKFKIASE